MPESATQTKSLADTPQPKVDTVQTKSVVNVAPLLHPILPDEGVVMLGSCFAQYMAERLTAAGWQVLTNPLGTLFNPFSIAATIGAALSVERTCFPVFETDGEWRCWWANTRVKAETEEQLLTMLRERYAALRESLLHARHLVITLGTNTCYQTSCKGGRTIVVTNCQRQPDRLFTEWRANTKEVSECLQGMVLRLLRENPRLQIILTVSPYRYHKYGYHGSQLSKATLLLAEEEIVKTFPQTCCYFPAYELLLDELRDYRYYAADGHHPGEAAVDIIWQRFALSASIN